MQLLQLLRRFRQSELRPRQPLDEVAAPHLAGQLHAAEDFVEDAPRQQPRIEQGQLAGHDAVAFQQQRCLRDGVRLRFGPAP